MFSGCVDHDWDKPLRREKTSLREMLCFLSLLFVQALVAGLGPFFPHGEKRTIWGGAPWILLCPWAHWRCAPPPLHPRLTVYPSARCCVPPPPSVEDSQSRSSRRFRPLHWDLAVCLLNICPCGHRGSPVPKNKREVRLHFPCITLQAFSNLGFSNINARVVSLAGTAFDDNEPESGAPDIVPMVVPGTDHL